MQIKYCDAYSNRFNIVGFTFYSNIKAFLTSKSCAKEFKKEIVDQSIISFN